jgi:membrane protease YdiL (CAAX protease family)
MNSAKNNETYPNLKQSLVLVILFFTFFSIYYMFIITIGLQLFDSAFAPIFKNFYLPLGSPVCTIPLILYVSKKSGIPINWTVVTQPQIHHILLLILLVISTVIITQPFIYPIEYFSDLIEGRFRFISIVVPEFNLLFILKFFTIVIIAPVFEEIFWRKQIFGLLLKKYSPALAIVLSSMLFACGHLRIYDFGSLFIWGLIFCFVYYKSKSIELSIFIHSISNLSTLFVKRVFIDIGEIQFFKWIMVTIISAIVFYLVISYFTRRSSIKTVSSFETKKN